MATITINRETEQRELTEDDVQVGDRVRVKGTSSKSGTTVTFEGITELHSATKRVVLPGFGPFDSRSEFKLESIEREDRRHFKLSDILWAEISALPSNHHVTWEDVIAIAKTLVAAGYTDPEGSK